MAKVVGGDGRSCCGCGSCGGGSGDGFVVVVEVVVKASEIVVKVSSDGINSAGGRGYTSDTRLNCERDVAGVCKRDAGLH